MSYFVYYILSQIMLHKNKDKFHFYSWNMKMLDTSQNDKDR